MKKSIDVIVYFDTEGKLHPIRIRVDDMAYDIDKVYDIRDCACLKYGGMGTRYTVGICGKKFYLFLEDNKWYVTECIDI